MNTFKRFRCCLVLFSFALGGSAFQSLVAMHLSGREILIKPLSPSSPTITIQDSLLELQEDSLFRQNEDPGLQVDRLGNTQLHNACRFGKLLLVEKLLKTSSSLDIRDALNRSNEKGEMPLHLACLGSENQDKIVALLLSYGVSLNARDSQGQTPLHIACYRGLKVAAAALVEGGADLDMPDNNGVTVSQLATKKDFNWVNELVILKEKLLKGHLPKKYLPVQSRVQKKSARRISTNGRIDTTKLFAKLCNQVRKSSEQNGAKDIEGRFSSLQITRNPSK